MTILLSATSLSKSFGARPLFDDISFGLFKGNRVGLIGPNGSGKSTLLRILAGDDTPDEGEISLRKSTRLAYLPQDSIFPSDKTALQVVLDALVKDPIHAKDEPFERETRALVALTRIGIHDTDQRAGTLSGGFRKRLAIASAFACEPDLILMDEPTNYLDLEGILALEEVLKESSITYLIATHDRYFLDHIATEVIELNRQYPTGMFQSEGSYARFLEKRADFFEAQLKQEDVLKNKVRREIEWLRRGPKARTTKAQGRIDGAEALMDDLKELKYRNAERKTVALDFTASERETRQLIVLKSVTKTLGERTLLNRLDLTLAPRTRIGRAGRNGSGNTTLLKLLSGALTQDSGTIKRADQLKVVVFDQTRDSLDKKQSLRRALAPDSDSVIYHDQSIHVVSWARRFLFRPEQLDVPVGTLSGGEQARILIARLMREPADVLLLDEPTNDLDIPTLEVLEESLLDFNGALVLITHDRYLLDRVSTRILGLDGQGGAEFFADYAQWETHYRKSERDATKATTNKIKATSTPSPTKSFSYRDKKEWEQMEAKILKAEEKLKACEAELLNPNIASNPEHLTAACLALETAQHAVDALYARWAELEEKRGESVSPSKAKTHATEANFKS